mmetsp:Transcript_47221/g.109575  ORF Transcript_47221/g.109575 Transcript_47221/m.109575 type:complete len:205 (-) Transcript_47221:423-1037(-)
MAFMSRRDAPPPYCLTERLLAASASKTACVACVTPNHLNAGLLVPGIFTLSSMPIESSTLQMSYRRRTFVFIAPQLGSLPCSSSTSSERAACSSESTPSSCVATAACSKRPMNLIESSPIDFSFRPRSSRSVSVASAPAPAAPAAPSTPAAKLPPPSACAFSSVCADGRGVSCNNLTAGTASAPIHSFSRAEMREGSVLMPSHL